MQARIIHGSQDKIVKLPYTNAILKEYLYLPKLYYAVV